MRKTKKALATLAIAGMVLSIAPLQMFAADATSTATRLYGTGRVETAIEIAKAGWTTADTVVVAPSADANLVDALAAAPLAGAKNAPILLTEGNALNAKTADEIKTLGAKTVYVVGAIDSAVVDQVKAVSGVTTVEALKGNGRVETAAAISAKLTDVKGTFVVGYQAEADALSVASYAAANNYKIVIAGTDAKVPASETVVGTTYTVGGAQLVADITGATRLSGLTRFETNADVLSKLTYSYDKVYVANGFNEHLVDSLVASVLAAKAKAPIVLASTSVKADLSDEVNADTTVVALGGPEVVTDAVRASVEYKAPATLEVESVSAVNSITVAVKFNKAVDQGTAEAEANYSIVKVGGSALDLDDTTPVDLQSDNQTVYLNLKSSANSLPTSATDYTVNVKDVNDTNGNEMTEYKALVSLKDNVRPTVTSAGFENTNVYKLEFSEPLQVADDTVVELYDGYDQITMGGDVNVVAGDDNESAEITGMSTLDDTKTYTVKVINAVDYSGNAISPNPYEKDIQISDDTTAPKVTAVSVINLKAFKVTFSEPIDTTDPAFVVDIDDSTEGATITAVDDTNDTQFTVELDTAIATEGLHKVTVKSFTDVSGNAPSKAYAAYFKFADSKPELTSTTGVIKTLSGKKYAVFTFNRDLDNDDSGFADITDGIYTDSDGITDDATLDADYFVLGASGDLAGLEDDQIAYNITDADPAIADGQYDFTIPAGFVTAYGDVNESVDVTFSYNASSSDVEVSKADTFTMADATTIDTDVAVNNSGTGENNVSEVIVAFTGDLNDTAKNASNYKIDGVSAFKSAVFYQDKSHVKLTLKDSAVKYDGLYQFAITGLQDENGKAAKDFNKTVRFLENQKPFIVSAKIKSTTRIDVTFNEALNAPALGAIDEDDFTVTVGGADADFSAASFTDGGKVVTLYLTDALDNMDTVVKVGTSSSFDGEDANGNVGQTSNVVTASWSTSADATAPAALTAGTIAVTATGATGTAEANATVKVVADGAAVTATAVKSVTAGADGSFTITGLTASTSYEVYVIDAAGNASAGYGITTPAV